MSDSPLEALQRRFVRSVTFMTDPELVAAVTGGGKLSAAEAVDVYRGGYPARLTDALGETYETCWRVLGDEGFFAAAQTYISRHPSRSHNLSDYGEAFPEFLESLRFDLGAAEVYVFTPKGQVIALPQGATPVDFAYAIHTEVGHRCIGARVNGRLVALESALDVVASDFL